MLIYGLFYSVDIHHEYRSTGFYGYKSGRENIVSRLLPKVINRFNANNRISNQ